MRSSEVLLPSMDRLLDLWVLIQYKSIINLTVYLKHE